MQQSRLFGMLYYLLEQGHATAPELAEKFEVSVRTIYRDVDALSGAGIPVYTETGRNGGIQLLDGYVLDRSLFSDQEKQALLSGIQSLAAVQFPEVDGVLKKLGAIFQIRLSDWIEVDFSRWGSIAEYENQLFVQIRQAVLEGRKIRFVYYDSTGAKREREAYPRKLVYKDRAWYLFAFCLTRQADRLFRLTRIKDFRLTETYFNELPEAAPEVYPQPRDMGALIDLELQFPLEVGYRLYDTLEDSAIVACENGYTVKLTLPETEWLYDFLMSFGERVTIIRPESVKQRIIEKYKAALARYP